MENYFEDVCKGLDKLKATRTKDFKMSFKAILYMSVLRNNYRAEKIAKNPPDIAIQLLGFICKTGGINFRLRNIFI